MMTMAQIEEKRLAKLARRRQRRAARKESFEILSVLRGAHKRMTPSDFYILFTKL